MYIGPWQEFKLAKILQIKEKMDKEAEEDNRLPPQQEEYNQDLMGTKVPPKAFSVGGKLQPMIQTQSNQKADSRVNMRRQQASIDNKYKYRMDPQFAAPSKKVPLLKSTYSQPTGGRDHRLQSRGGGGMNRNQHSPETSVSNYSHAQSSQINNSTQYTTGAINKK